MEVVGREDEFERLADLNGGWWSGRRRCVARMRTVMPTTKVVM